MTSNLQVVPRTTRIVEQIFEATSMTSGNIKFSKLDPGTHMYTHTFTGIPLCDASKSSAPPARHMSLQTPSLRPEQPAHPHALRSLLTPALVLFSLFIMLP